MSLPSRSLGLDGRGARRLRSLLGNGLTGESEDQGNSTHVSQHGQHSDPETVLVGGD
jgi:hypothetical protein